jgi:hypothetical protein
MSPRASSSRGSVGWLILFQPSIFLAVISSKMNLIITKMHYDEPWLISDRILAHRW